MSLKTGIKKAGHLTGFFYRELCLVSAVLHRADASIQTALVTCAFVGADQAFASNAVDKRHGVFIEGLGLVFLAGVDSINHFFHRGAEGGTLASVKLTVFFRLAGAFSGLC